MRTPAGTECPFYYEDFHRGRDQQECRLIERTPNGGMYTPDLCARCKVPRILQANACEHMVLEAQATAGILGFRRRVDVSAFCTRSMQDVEVPEVGCPMCHTDLPDLTLPPEKS